MFLTETQPTSPNQHGFLAHRSRLSSLRPQEALARRLINDSHRVDLVYLEFARALSIVNQQFQLTKSKPFGTDRNVQKCLNERQFLFDEAPSQGFVIVPLAFLLCINDLKATRDDSHFLLLNFVR